MLFYASGIPCRRSLFVALVVAMGWLSNSVEVAMAADHLGLSKSKPADGIAVQVEGGYMVPYKVKIPGTDAVFEMIPVPGGRVKIGSPESEVGREANEGPQVEVIVEPFWMGKTEVTWLEYKSFMRTYNVYKELSANGIRKVNPSNEIDAITVPTPLYVPSHTFEFGEDPNQPAVTMTQYAAKQYTKWLSGLTSQQYRLPSEAEWEYAARANSKGAYCFGDDPEKLKEFGCFEGNNEGGPAKVASKKPNAFGLFDMHGNVWEWTLDAFTTDGYAALKNAPLKSIDAIQWSKDAYPRTVRGGGWQDPPTRLRSAARLGSDDEEWKTEDPNVPLSPWWFTSDPTRSIGFRLLRSSTTLPKAEMERFWTYDSEDVKLDVESRLEEGRGAQGLAVPELGADLEKSR